MKDIHYSQYDTTYKRVVILLVDGDASIVDWSKNGPKYSSITSMEIQKDK